MAFLPRFARCAGRRNMKLLPLASSEILDLVAGWLAQKENYQWLDFRSDPARRAEMGKYGRSRVENELEWRHEAPKLLAAYEALWHSSRVSPAARGVET